MTVHFTAIPSGQAEAFRAGQADAYGNAPERLTSPGGMPCRHCLGLIDAGEPMPVLAYRPFPTLQPYAETGPIFLHAAACPRYEAAEILPPMLNSPDYIVRGYGPNDRIVYGTGAVTPTTRIAAYAAQLLARDDVAYVHVRSARNNCFQCRIGRPGA
ncbi:DUF1203 domain-containing protein [Rhizobiaceae bacterium BDR2-2]|uniref:DUF1203 domain-containing protein n=1 Tax=Ectorhizobium quercum TaxID=2965071 RepID=A0AAE3N1G6_9HYPH|nr:DUF1203 domain-containing protein [Ectorhizobium quercum]MCX8997545.1 DUF1203 domain-containing protein [Ectorhizobium quercum]